MIDEGLPNIEIKILEDSSLFLFSIMNTDNVHKEDADDVVRFRNTTLKVKSANRSKYIIFKGFVELLIESSG